MKSIFIRLILPICILILWESFARILNNAALLPSVFSVLHCLIHPFQDLIGTGNYFHHIVISGIRVLGGFFLAILIGVPLGLLAGRVTLFHDMINPLIEFLRPLCPIAWIPFALVVFKTYTIADLFGFHYTRTMFGDIQIGMLLVIFYGGFFPIFLNTLYGVNSVKNIYIESAQMLGCDRKKLFRHIILPSAFPSILTGLRIGLGTAWMVIIAAEMLPGSESGVGYLIIYAYELAEMDVMIMGMILTGSVGALLSFSLKLVSNHVAHWQAKER